MSAAHQKRSLFVTFRYNSPFVAALRFREGFMLEMLMQWYRCRFSDPEAIALLVILLAGFGIMFFFSGLLAPLLVAIVLAYLLEWPTVRLERIGLSRTWATSLVLILFVGILLLLAFVVLPVAWQQGIYLIRDMPGMLNKLSDFAATRRGAIRR